MRLLSDHLVSLKLVEIHQRTDRGQGANNVALKPWRTEQWCLPPEHRKAFVCAMEVYASPRAPTTNQSGDSQPQAARMAGEAEQYQRHGAHMTGRRAACDWAQTTQSLCDEVYP